MTMADLHPTYHRILEGGLVAGGRGRAVWSADGAGLWYESRGRLGLFDPGTAAPILDLDTDALRRTVADLLGKPFTGALPLESLRLGADGAVRMTVAGVTLAIDPAGGPARMLGEPAKAVPGAFARDMFMFTAHQVPDAVSPDGRLIATVRDGDIVLTEADTGRSVRVTDTAAERFGWDLESRRPDVLNMRAVQADPWSPTARHLFAVRLDRRGVAQAPDYQPLALPVPRAPSRDWYRAGEPDYVHHPAIVDVAAGVARPIEGVPATDGFLLLLAWAADGRTVWFAKFNRDFSRIDLYAAGIDGTPARLLHREEGPPGLRSPHQAFYAGNIGFLPLPDAGGPYEGGFVWLSERDGWSRPWLHDRDGKAVRPLAEPGFVAETVVAPAPDGGSVFVTIRSDPDHPYDVHLHRVPLDGGPSLRLTSGRGLHDAPRLSPDGRWFVDQFSSPVTPPRTEIRGTDGALALLVEEADTAPLQAIGWTPPLEFTVKAADGVTDIHGVMYRPAGFDPARRYPVIESVYGGPPMIWADKVFLAEQGGAASLAPALAQLGYLVVKLDTPGTPGRSRAFRMAVTDRWGPGLAHDHADAIRALAATYPYVDADRVGIYGHSWGGYNALMALAVRGDVYKAGVATAPGGTYGAQYDKFMQYYLGDPAANPEAWSRSDLLPRLDAIARPLLLGIGTQDYGLFPLMMHVSDRLIRRGFQHELVLAPGMGHGIYGAHERYLTEKLTRFFLAHVPPGPR